MTDPVTTTERGRSKRRHVAFFAPYTEHVGTEGAMENLAAGFEAAGDQVDMVQVYREWSDDVAGRVVPVGTATTTRGIDRLPFPWKKFLLAGTGFVGLVRYLRRQEPDVLVAGLLNAVAILARDLAGVDTRVVCSVQGLPQPDRIRRFLWPRLYRNADAVVVPVQSIADRVVDIADLHHQRVEVIPNPVVSDDFLERGQARPTHPWFGGEAPVIVSVGRQTRQKDFSTLLRAFADVRADRDARLVVAGKQDEQTEQLRSLTAELGLTDCVDFPGFVDNVAAYIAAADVFVLSSRWEGPGHVLVEALALGTPVVATDCPLGPREILDNGDAGKLVPVGDHEAMATAVQELLDSPAKRDEYARAGPPRVEGFRVDSAIEGYLRLVSDLHPSGSGNGAGE